MIHETGDIFTRDGYIFVASTVKEDSMGMSYYGVRTKELDRPFWRKIAKHFGLTLKRVPMHYNVGTDKAFTHIGHLRDIPFYATRINRTDGEKPTRRQARRRSGGTAEQ